VSTAFNNLHLNRIEEVIHETSILPTELLQIVDGLDDDSLQKSTDQYGNNIIFSLFINHSFILSFSDS